VLSVAVSNSLQSLENLNESALKHFSTLTLLTGIPACKNSALIIPKSLLFWEMTKPEVIPEKLAG